MLDLLRARESGRDVILCICGHGESVHAPTGRRACVSQDDRGRVCPCMIFREDDWQPDP